MLRSRSSLGAGGGEGVPAISYTLTEVLKLVHDADGSARARLLAPGNDTGFDQGGVTPASSRASWPVSFMLQLAMVCMRCSPTPHQARQDIDLQRHPENGATSAARGAGGARGSGGGSGGRSNHSLGGGRSLQEGSSGGGVGQGPSSRSPPPPLGLHIPRVEAALDPGVPLHWIRPRPSLHMMLWSAVRCVGGRCGEGCGLDGDACIKQESCRGHKWGTMGATPLGHTMW